ncbi:uncharacterized protein NPIL_376931 [Nephila pilipes]|uniref:Uncharacterized protein n=1 Tax=Nephila pilipes TaxID=299642 RepID=A0A8X6N2B7_NEPPI|nr:uncharacterized protein NPIL_376931 [Nephila pilipes]
MKDNIYKVNEEVIFRETEFRWVAGGRLQENKNNNNLPCYLLKDDNSVEDTLKLFFELESLGIKDTPYYQEDDKGMNIFKETTQFINERYVVELPFRKNWKELSDNFPVAKQRFQNLWRRLQRDKILYSQYRETIQDYMNQGIIEKIENTEANIHKPVYNLHHQAVKMEGRVKTSTRIVFDAASHQTNEFSLNDCLWSDPNLNPNLLDVLINFMLNRSAISSDIRQDFLQICLVDKHKDAERFLWTESQDTREEALLISLHAQNIMKEAGMEMRKLISNDTTLLSQWAAEGLNTYPVNTSVSLGSNKTKIKECKVFHWIDCKIVLFWIKGSGKKWKPFVTNRVQEITKLTDPDSSFLCSGKDNPSDLLSRVLSAVSLLSDDKWWNCPSFLQFDELSGTDSECPELNEEEYLPELKSKDSKENVVLTLNLNETIFKYLLT